MEYGAILVDKNRASLTAIEPAVTLQVC
jgi:hypothetical protein